MKKTSYTVALASLAIFGSAAALADDKNSKGVPGVDADVTAEDRGVPGMDMDITNTADLSSLDKNTDGKLSKSEAASNRELNREFGDLDTNKDGHLDEGEFAKFEASASTGKTGDKKGANTEKNSDR